MMPWLGRKRCRVAFLVYQGVGFSFVEPLCLLAVRHQTTMLIEGVGF